MADKPKVTAELEPRQVTIDADTGDATVQRKGKFKGFGKGFQDYVMRGPEHVGAEVNIGQFPVGHPQEGEWAVQIILSPLSTKESAETLADQLTPVIEKALRQKAVKAR